MAREESGIQSPDSAWKKNERAISSSPILQRSEYLLREEVSQHSFITQPQTNDENIFNRKKKKEEENLDQWL